MGVTANYSLPYPELSDPPNVPQDLQRGMTAIDTKFAQVDAAIATSAYTAPTLATAALYANAQQTIQQGVWTDVNFQVEQVDILNGHSTDTLTQKYKVPQGGQYHIVGSGGFDTTDDSDGMFAMSIRLLKANDNLYHYIAYASGTPVFKHIEWMASVAFIGPLNAGDMVSLGMLHKGTGGPRKTTSPSNYPCRLGIRQFL